jgi:hypothetical protein
MTTRQLPMSEADWQKRITDYCDILKLRWHHEVDSRKSKSGWPDLVIAGRRVIFVELKKEDGRLDPEQAAWLRSLHAAGAEAHCWRPSDWPVVAKRLRALAGRR